MMKNSKTRPRSSSEPGIDINRNRKSNISDDRKREKSWGKEIMYNTRFTHSSRSSAKSYGNRNRNQFQYPPPWGDMSIRHRPMSSRMSRVSSQRSTFMDHVSTEAPIESSTAWSLFWLMVLLLIAWPLGLICSITYIVLLPFASEYGFLQPVMDVLRSAQMVPYTCARNMSCGTPLMEVGAEKQPLKLEFRGCYPLAYSDRDEIFEMREMIEDSDESTCWDKESRESEDQGDLYLSCRQ